MSTRSSPAPINPSVDPYQLHSGGLAERDIRDNVAIP